MLFDIIAFCAACALAGFLCTCVGYWYGHRNGRKIMKKRVVRYMKSDADRTDSLALWECFMKISKWER